MKKTNKPYRETDQREENLEDSEIKTLSFIEAYQEAKENLSRQFGVFLERSKSGQFCLHNLYSVGVPQRFLGRYGLNPDREYWCKIPVTASQVKAVIHHLYSYDPNKIPLWVKIINPLLLGETKTGTSEIRRYAQTLLDLEDLERERESFRREETNLDPEGQAITTLDNPVRAFVPPVEWFPERVTQLEPHEIVTLLPEAELRLLMLCVGRALVGHSNTVLATGRTIDHTFRTCPVLISEAGLGKSELLDRGLWRAARLLGYRVSTFGSLGSRFNMGEVVSSDIIYKDDINDLKSLFKGDNFKIIVTGGTLRTEDKGKDAINLRSHGVVFVCANEFDPRIAYGIDGGVASRLKPLQCYSRLKLENRIIDGVCEDSPNLLPEFHIPWLANKLGTTPECLYIWFLRLSVDYFLSQCKNSPLEPNKLHDTVHRLTAQSKLTVAKDATGNILLSAYFALCLSQDNLETVKPPKFNEVDWYHAISKLIDLKVNLSLVEWLRKDWENGGYKIQHPYPGIRDINITTLKEALREYKFCIEQRKGYKETLKSLFSAILLTNGFEISSDTVWLNQAYTNSVHNTGSELNSLLGRLALTHESRVNPEASIEV